MEADEVNPRQTRFEAGAPERSRSSWSRGFRRGIVALGIVVLAASFRPGPASAAGEIDVSRIRVNDETVYDAKSGSSAFIASFGGQARYALQQLAAFLGVIFDWDPATKEARFIKPEVSLLALSYAGKNDQGALSLYGPFSLVKAGERLERFFVYAEVNNLPEANMDFRLVASAAGRTAAGEFAVVPGTVRLPERGGWIVFEVKNARFGDPGSYRLQLQVKGKATGDRYVTVGEKTIVATR
ncbi:MAG: hypothetical protein HSCHL_1793 [Hydrogenibacillus schlegelii]|uniref:Copper amine oxidase-like N-terminal domain-containing protein n=1 Tax=Hydrogenibacillus schlegelii TaxID=1484 RepID=A0A2T5GFB5_HYDSH|nr:MAG: hypothetical protein HSCHL_1793 [Hydrogenibacillus schlegelii]